MTSFMMLITIDKKYKYVKIYHNMQFKRKTLQIFFGTIIIHIMKASDTNPLYTQSSEHNFVEKVLNPDPESILNNSTRPNTTEKNILINFNAYLNLKYCVLLYKTPKSITEQKINVYSVLEPFIKKHGKNSKTYTLINAGCKNTDKDRFYQIYFFETLNCYRNIYKKVTENYNAKKPSITVTETDIKRNTHFSSSYDPIEFYKHSNSIEDVGMVNNINSQISEPVFCFSIIDASDSLSALFSEHCKNINYIADRIYDESSNALILIFDNIDTEFFDKLKALTDNTNKIFTAVYFGETKIDNKDQFEIKNIEYKKKNNA